MNPDLYYRFFHRCQDSLRTEYYCATLGVLERHDEESDYLCVRIDSSLRDDLAKQFTEPEEIN